MLTNLPPPEMKLIHLCSGIGLHRSPLSTRLIDEWMAEIVSLKGNVRQKIWDYCDCDRLLTWLASESTKAANLSTTWDRSKGIKE
jgi:hypothetical protein